MEAKDNIAALVWGMLQQLDANPSRSGIKETPARVAKYLEEITAGSRVSPKSLHALLKTFTDGASGYDEMIFEENIPFYSLCEHHMATFFGVAHIGYIPNKKIVGLSKLPRLVEVFASRLQVQERLTTQIAKAMMSSLKPKGVGVVLQGRHMCMEARGIKRAGIITTTSALGGNFRQAVVRSEFLGFVQMAKRGVL